MGTLGAINNERNVDDSPPRAVALLHHIGADIPFWTIRRLPGKRLLDLAGGCGVRERSISAATAAFSAFLPATLAMRDGSGSREQYVRNVGGLLLPNAPVSPTQMVSSKVSFLTADCTCHLLSIEPLET